MALKRDRLSFNQNFCEVNVSFNEETTQSYIDAIERKDTKTFTDYNRLEKELDEKQSGLNNKKPLCQPDITEHINISWVYWIRTSTLRIQSPLPYQFG